MQPEMISGWRFRVAHARMSLHVMKERLFAPKGSLLTLKGMVQSRKLFQSLGINRWVLYNGAYRINMIVPPFPSKAFDHMLHRGGMNCHDVGSASRPYMDLVMVGMTRRCSIGTCDHCYERHNLAPKDDVPVEKIHDIVDRVQELGAGVIALTGGEPLDTRERLLSILQRGDKSRSEFQLYTTGKGLTREYARELADAGLGSALVSLDGWEDESHDAFRKKKGLLKQTLDSIGWLTDAGIYPFTNVTLNTNLVRTPDGLLRQWQLARDVGIAAIRYIEPKICGGYLKLDPEFLFSNDDREVLRRFVHDARHGAFGPGPMPFYLDDEERLVGCRLAGMLLMYVDTAGNVQPCVFLPISFGNILDEPFATILDRMRGSVSRPIPGGCMGLQLAPTIRKLAADGVRPPVPFEAVREEWLQRV